MFESILFVIIFSPLPNIEKEFFKASEVVFRTLQRKFSIVKRISKVFDHSLWSIDEFRNLKFGQSLMKFILIDEIKN